MIKCVLMYKKKKKKITKLHKQFGEHGRNPKEIFRISTEKEKTRPLLEGVKFM